MSNDLALTLIHDPVGAPSPSGCIDFFGYSGALGGLIIGGWIGFDWDDPVDAPPILLRMGEENIKGTAVICLHPREDVKKRGLGFVLYASLDQVPEEPIADLVLYSGMRSVRIEPSNMMEQFDEARLLAHSKSFITQSQRNNSRALLLKLLERPHYQGIDTLDKLAQPILISFDKTYLCPPSGVLLRGWFIDPFSQVARLKLRCGARSCSMSPDKWIVVPRPDVRAGFAAQYGLSDDNCGFVAYAPGVYIEGEALYLEIETLSGEIGYSMVEAPHSTGLGAIREILGIIDLRFDALTHGYDHVIGPAIEAMNNFRLAKGAREQTVRYGEQPAPIRCSVIIPLYGRIDFLEYQLAFFSRTLAFDHELIFVLDDPPRLRETEALAASVYARFQRPFSLVSLSQNLGFAPANNVGLKYAQGEFICYLNSDIFPGEPNWLEYMLDTAMSSPGVGIVGAYLVYEDGTIQHEGCSFETLPEFGGWTFPVHPNKGRRLPETRPIATVPAVTGACMVMARSLAIELGGFDEGFVVGDFEDADLCMRIKQKGLSCVVDFRAQLYHLERQSQGDQAQSWRMNLSLYNAWRFHNRWGRANHGT